MNFGELVTLMVLGTDEPDSLAGVVRHSSPDDEDWSHRIWRRGRLARRENLAGRVLSITGDAMRWTRHAGDDEFTAFPTDGHSFASSYPIGGLEPGGRRPSFSRWDGTDFTRPTGPVTATSFLGRECWQVELAPPSHKPYPIQLTVDAATGLVLRDANRDFGSSTGFTEVQIGGELPDELFVWDGPARTAAEADAERESEHDRDLAGRRAWLDARGIVLDLPLRPEVQLREWSDDTGELHATLRLSAHGALSRRPVSSETWAAAEGTHYDHAYRWRDARWDWLLATSEPIADEHLALLKQQLATST